ncbi:MAG: carbamoyltransferase HypF, partial [Kiritimatiellaeota bacterium]|nr:carbamoyltransferase HypF [Kiritimatiellota bacterium]
MIRRVKISIRGRVQGVGFRPTVWRYATAAGLTGFVRNTAAGVDAEAQGAAEAVGQFLERLQQHPPPQALVETFTTAELPADHDAQPFRIERSQSSSDLLVGLPPDLATCPDCAREIRDPANRRFGYPFTNCTCCGPRFTIVHELPYDRERTSMAPFIMCPACRAEYEQPADRRFDAQPNTCPVCGPQLRLLDAHGDPVAAAEPLAAAADLLRQGAVVAVKGLGGYQLCCDATGDDPVRNLRLRKQRSGKPLAVMFRSLDEIRAHCTVDEAEADELQSFAAPIVILNRRPETRLPRLISPDTDDIGAFLPCTPLHHLLLDRISPLIVTSGNRTEEPLAADEAELNHLLGTLADFALVHNRSIVRRCDDSVLRLVGGRRLFYRRARGWVPEAVPLPFTGPAVLAVGGDLKNVFCLTRRRQAILSQHIGNLDEVASLSFLQKSVADFMRLLKVQPQIVAHDLHPDYISTRFAREFPAPTHVAVQHHHAHIAAGM